MPYRLRNVSLTPPSPGAPLSTLNYSCFPSLDLEKATMGGVELYEEYVGEYVAVGQDVC